MTKTKPQSRIGAYCRVSTTDKQTTASQKHAIRQWMKAAHITPQAVKWYEDQQSGKTIDRPSLNRLLNHVRLGKIDTLVVFSLSRLARNTREGLQVLSDLAKRGIRVVSISENIDFGSSVGNLIATILLAVAAFERETTIERIRAGMQAAKANGKHVGRPRDLKRLALIWKAYDKGQTVQQIANTLGCSRQNCYHALKKRQQEVTPSAA